jgi:hypothetical protein
LKREGPASSGPRPKDTEWTLPMRALRPAATKRGPPRTARPAVGPYRISLLPPPFPLLARQRP